ncbi:hypothetical protein Cni_G22870 [Canna indica]|uniref:Uncharacterized protein n=1 Tax=Canna indica TaxID=4628 RepID=A0AAQ3KTD8_9LILI|nr:hypothetical protein Cni_G22870 [Canna indica]
MHHPIPHNSGVQGDPVRRHPPPLHLLPLSIQQLLRRARRNCRLAAPVAVKLHHLFREPDSFLLLPLPPPLLLLCPLPLSLPCAFTESVSVRDYEGGTFSGGGTGGAPEEEMQGRHQGGGGGLLWTAAAEKEKGICRQRAMRMTVPDTTAAVARATP